MSQTNSSNVNDSNVCDIIVISLNINERKAYRFVDERKSWGFRDSCSKRLLLFPHNGMSQSKVLIGLEM